MTDTDDVDDKAIVEDLVDNAVIADTHPVRTGFTRQRHTPGRSRILGQQVDRHLDTPLLPARKGSQRLDCSAGDVDAITLQSRPRSALTSSQGT